MTAETGKLILDGDDMINKTGIRCQLLSTAWVTPKGDFGMNISGFDYTLWVYDRASLKSRFWFDNEGSDDCFELCVMGNEKLTDSEGRQLFTLNSMRYDNGRIKVCLMRTSDGSSLCAELVRAAGIPEE